MKMSLSEKIMNFFVMHVEKIVLVLAVALVVVFVWNGNSKQSYSKKPDQLVVNVDSATKTVNTGTTWEQLTEAESRDPQRDYLADARIGRLPTKEDMYKTPVPLAPITRRPLIKRRDPEIFPATDVEVSAVNGPLAEDMNLNQVDLLAELPPADPRPEDKPKRRRKKEKEENVAAGPSGYPSSGKGMGVMMGGGGGGRRGKNDDKSSMPAMGVVMSGPGTQEDTKNDKDKTPVMRVLTGPFGDYHPGGSRAGRPGGIMATMMSSVAMSAPPGGGKGLATTDNSGVVKPPAEPKATGAVIVSVKALVPYKKQVEEYEAALDNTYDWSPQQDSLQYLGFTVERADVTDDPSGEPKWDPQAKWNSWSVKKQFADRFGSRQADEMADPAYLLADSLSLPIPPVMWRNLESLAVHSKIPHMVTLERETPSEEQPEDNENPSDLPPDFLARQGAGAGGTGFPSSDRMGGGGVMMSAPVMSMGGGRPSSGGASRSYPSSGKGMMGMPSGIVMGGMGGGGMYGGMFGGSGTVSVSEFKMVRFFDLTAKPGHKYRYRVQLQVIDPNHPTVHNVNERGLAPEVITRLHELTKEEQKLGYEKYWRSTEWSQPSPVFEVPESPRLFIGSPEGFDAVSTVTTSTGLELPVKLPTIEAVGVVWDDKYAADLPLPVKAEPGRVLDQSQATLEVAHPIDLTIHKLEDYDFRTHLTIVDVRGGELVGGDRENPLYAPTEALVLDSKGRLSIRTELDDAELYRVYTFENERDDVAPGSGGGLGMPGMGMPGEPGSGAAATAPMSGMPGMPGSAPSGKGGGRRR